MQRGAHAVLGVIGADLPADTAQHRDHRRGPRRPDRRPGSPTRRQQVVRLGQPGISPARRARPLRAAGVVAKQSFSTPAISSGTPRPHTPPSSSETVPRVVIPAECARRGAARSPVCPAAGPRRPKAMVMAVWRSECADNRSHSQIPAAAASRRTSSTAGWAHPPAAGGGQQRPRPSDATVEPHSGGPVIEVGADRLQGGGDSGTFARRSAPGTLEHGQHLMPRSDPRSPMSAPRASSTRSALCSNSRITAALPTGPRP